MSQTTIVALSSGALPSGVAVIRLSGPQAFAAVKALCTILPEPRKLTLTVLRHPATGEGLDSGLVALFPGPKSFTGEDCAELQVHGSPAGVKAILAVLTAMHGVVLAGPGDFTRRAFEHGKLDLTAIEGLGDMLAAETEAQRRQALMRLQGGLARQIDRWRHILLDTRAEIEAHLDFADEDDVPELLPDHFTRDLTGLKSELEQALSSFEAGRIQREGFRVVLAGPPNAGKSSLLNALAGSDLAIVTDEAGTTRDTKDVAIDLDGQLVILTDTAGLRHTESKAESEGIRRARDAMEHADLILWLMAPDIRAEQSPPVADAPVLRIATKGDIATIAPTPEHDLKISAQSGAGLRDLISAIRNHIEARLGSGETILVSHLRDRQSIRSAIVHVDTALQRIVQPELCAEELRSASDVLARLIGLMDTEAVLDKLFTGFCIGK